LQCLLNLRYFSATLESSLMKAMFQLLSELGFAKTAFINDSSILFKLT
jgi:hypothetical protein